LHMCPSGGIQTNMKMKRAKSSGSKDRTVIAVYNKLTELTALLSELVDIQELTDTIVLQVSRGYDYIHNLTENSLFISLILFFLVIGCASSLFEQVIILHKTAALSQQRLTRSTTPYGMVPLFNGLNLISAVKDS